MAAYFEGRRRGVVRLSIPPKAAYFEGRRRGVVRLGVVRGDGGGVVGGGGEGDKWNYLVMI